MFPVAILAGGIASRMRPRTERVPKSLLEVAGRPFIAHQLELLRHQGVTAVVLCVGHLGEQIEAFVGDGRTWGLRVGYSHDGAPLLGTGGALRRALPLLGDAFFVMYGDSYLPCDFGAVAAAFTASGRAGLMTVFRNDDALEPSNVRFERGEIVRYQKGAADPAMQYIDYGLGVLSRGALARGPDGEAFDLASVYQQLVAERQLAAYKVGERFYEIGSPDGLRDTEALLTARRPRS